MSEKRDPERVVREIKRKTRRKFSAEEKIRIVLEGLIDEGNWNRHSPPLPLAALPPSVTFPCN